MSQFFTGFVPGTNWVCPWDKSGENWDQPDKKGYVYVPFSCLRGGEGEADLRVGSGGPVPNKPLKSLAHQTALASAFRVDRAKSPEFSQTEWVLGSEIAESQIASDFHRTSNRNAALLCLRAYR